MPFTLNQIIIKITIGRRFFLRKQKAQREFYSYCSISWNYSSTVFSQVKKSWWLERDRRGRKTSTRSQNLGSHTLWNWWPCKGLFLMANDLSQGLVTSFKRQAITLVETTLTTWTSSKVFLLLVILQVVRMITTSKDGFWQSDAEILNSLKDRSFKLWRGFTNVKKKDWFCFCFVGWPSIRVAVDLLDENRSVLKKSDWPYYALGIPDFES